MNSLRAALLLVAGALTTCPPLGAQEDRLLSDPVPGVERLAAVLALPLAPDDVLSGAAGVLAQAVEDRLGPHEAPSAAGPGRRHAVTLSRGSLRIAVDGEVGQHVLDGLEDLVDVADGTRTLGDGEAERAVARARLRADDESELFPGDVLETRARRRIFAAGGGVAAAPVRGRAEDLVEFADPARLRLAWRRAFSAPGPVLVLVGRVRARDHERARALLERLGPAAAPPTPAGDAETAVDGAGAGAKGPPASSFRHVHSGAHWVALAIPSPDPRDVREALSFALAVDVLDQRVAAAGWRPRRNELWARAPFVRFAGAEHDRPGVALVIRRGIDDGDGSRAAAEIDALLDGLRRQPISPAEWNRARAKVGGGWIRWPLDVDEEERCLQSPRRLVRVADRIARQRLLGITAAEVAEVLRGATLAETREALDLALAEAVRLRLEPL